MQLAAAIGRAKRRGQREGLGDLKSKEWDAAAKRGCFLWSEVYVGCRSIKDAVIREKRGRQEYNRHLSHDNKDTSFRDW